VQQVGVKFYICESALFLVLQLWWAKYP